MSDYDLPGVLRRIRRSADLSQRQLARAGGTPKTAIAAAEAGTRGLDARTLARLAGVAGLRLALLDRDGREVAPMDGAAVRDEGGRHFPAHLDPRHGDEDWWHGPHRYDREPVTYTFTRVRRDRDALRRAHGGTPEDHRRPEPGDGLADRAAARRVAARRARDDERRRRLAAGEIGLPDLRFPCECPPACDDLDDRSGPPRHAAACPCGCDLG